MRIPQKSLVPTCLLFFVLSSPLSATTLEVPAQYPTIQDAIDAAVDGDLVLVWPGTYVETIDLRGKAIEVRGLDGASTTTSISTEI